jgi:hypothetical protein
MGLVPHGALVTDGAPFVAAYEAIFNGAGIGEFEKLEGCVTCLSVRLRHRCDGT